MEGNMELRSRSGECFVPIDDDGGNSSTQTSPLLAAPETSFSFAGQQSSDEIKKITAAVREGRQNKLEELLEHYSMDQVHTEVKDNLLMHQVIDKGSPEMFEMLFKKMKHRDVNENSSLPTLEVQINATDDKLFTAVHKATINNKQSVLRQLLDNGGDRWAQTVRGHTPLHIAASHGFYKCAEFLLSDLDVVHKKKYMNVTAKDLSTALIRAAKYDRSRVGCLLRDSDINLADSDGNTALHYAAQKGSKALISFLLARAADTSKKNQDSRTPLEMLLSCDKDDVDCFESLFKSTSENETTETLQTILKEAVLSNSCKCVKVILAKQGAKRLIDYQFPQEDNNTALHLSLARGHYSIALLLLDNGAKKDIQNNQLEFPVHLIARKGVSLNGDEDDRLKVHKKVMKFELLESATVEGKTALVLAVESGNEEMVRDLLRRRCSRAAGIIKAAKLGKESCLKMLLKMIPERQLEELRKVKSHPLHVAAENGKLSSCKILVESLKDASLTLVEDSNKKYPVDVAYEAKHYDVFRYLLENMKYDLEQEDFAVRLHGYCKESILEKMRAPLDAIVSSRWSRVAFDTYFCNDLRKAFTKRCEEDKKPCNSLALLIKAFPQMAAKALDQYVTVTEEYEELDYTPFEFGYYHEQGGKLVPYFEKSPLEQESSTKQKLHCLDQIHPEAKTFSSQLCWKANPLEKATESTDNAVVLTHQLSKSWMKRKYKAYAKWFLLAWVLIDLLTAVLTTVFIALIRNTHQLESLYNGADRNEITKVFNEAIQAIVDEIKIVASNDVSCSSFSVPNSAGMVDYSPGSAVWNRSVCAIGKLESRTPGLVSIQMVVFLMLLIHLVLGYRIVSKMHTKWYKSTSMFRLVQLIFLAAILVPFSICDFQFGLREVTQWQFGVVSVLLAWLSLINTLNKVPTLTVFMQITLNFVWAYVKIIMFIFFIILAFALTFHFLLQAEEPGFSTLPYSLIKTLVWMLGDLGYNDTFLKEDSPVTYPIQANLLFTFFVTIIGAFVFNLLVKKPTNLLEQIKNNEDFYQTKSLLRLILFVDEGFAKVKRKHTFRRLRLGPPKKSSSNQGSRSEQSSVVGYKQGICDSGKGVDDLYIQQQDLVRKLDLLRDDLTAVSKLVEELHSSGQPTKEDEEHTKVNVEQ